MLKWVFAIVVGSSPVFAAPVAADGFLKGVPKPVAPVECVWEEALEVRSELHLGFLQAHLGRVIEIAARHEATDRPGLFRVGGAPVPEKRRLRIVLTDRARPVLRGKLLPPLAEQMLSVAMPTVDDDGGVTVHVFLKINAMLLDGPGSLKLDGTGLALAAFGHTLFSAVPVYLRMTDAELRAFGRDAKAHFARERGIAERAIRYFESVLGDRSLHYLDRIPSHWGLAEQRRRLAAALAETPSAAEETAIPFQMGYVGPSQRSEAPPRHVLDVFQPTVDRAMRIVAEYPPEGAWNNFFTWDPTARASLANKSAILIVQNSPVGELNPLSRAIGSPLRGGDIWGGTLDLLGDGTQEFHTWLVARSVFLDEKERPRPDRLPRMVAFLGGEIYGHLHERLLRSYAEARRLAVPSALSPLAMTQQDLRTRRAALGTLQRYMASAEFYRLPEAEKIRFEPVLHETQCALQLLDAALSEAK